MYGKSLVFRLKTSYNKYQNIIFYVGVKDMRGSETFSSNINSFYENYRSITTPRTDNNTLLQYIKRQERFHYF